METEIVRALEGAAYAHHETWLDMDGINPGWSTWYAVWLLQESESSDLFSQYFGTSQLADLLNTLDGRYRHSEESFSWCQLYARDIHRIIANQTMSTR